jgi:hypothetical protein
MYYEARKRRGQIMKQENEESKLGSKKTKRINLIVKQE